MSADTRPRGFDGVLIVAIVDRSEQIALVDDLVVNHRNRSQVAHRLGGDDRGVGADIGVVGRDQEPPLDEIVISCFAAVTDRGEEQNGHDKSAQARSLGRSGCDAREAAAGECASAPDEPAQEGRPTGGVSFIAGVSAGDLSARSRDLDVIGHVKSLP